MLKITRASKLLVILLVVITFSSCGYLPSAKYARAVLGDNISTEVIISQTDPENSVLAKDAVDRAIIEVFHASLSTKEYADTHLILKISDPYYNALEYDKNGYIISYRTTIVLSITKKSRGLEKNYTSKGTYDFSVDPNAVLTDKQRFDAIKYSSIKAISAFLAQVSAEGFNKNRKKTR